jgi:TolB protein
MDLATRENTRITNAQGLDLRPQPLSDGSVVHISKRGSGDEVAVIDPAGTRRVLAIASVASLARPAVSPDGRRLAVPLPVLSGTDWALQLMDVGGGPMTEILSGGAFAIMPAWGPDGSILFARADDRGVFGLWRIDAGGGTPRAVTPSSWDWGEPTTRVIVRTQVAGGDQVPARVHIVDRDGHPAFPSGGQVWLDGQSGMIFSYSPGTLEFEIPVGSYRAVATHGFEYLPVRGEGDAVSGVQSGMVLEFTPLGGPSMDGWYSGDHHFHLNYGGQVRLAPEALVPMMRGEDLDVATPLSANLHTRRIDEDYFAWTRAEPPLIQFGQEVRSHFLGHTGHIGVKTLFWPWYWGPNYPVYGRDDRSNVSALRQTREQGGVNSYVHPVSGRDPFGGDAPRGIPLELVSDAVLGDVDTIELACLWSDELGTADAWYRLLSVGATVTPSAGTDAMVDFFRTMAVGTTRVYVNVPGELTMDRYLDGLRAGRSFVTNGPLIRFTVASAGPGDVLHADRRRPVRAGRRVRLAVRARRDPRQRRGRVDGRRHHATGHDRSPRHRHGAGGRLDRRARPRRGNGVARHGQLPLRPYRAALDRLTRQHRSSGRGTRREGAARRARRRRTARPAVVRRHANASTARAAGAGAEAARTAHALSAVSLAVTSRTHPPAAVLLRVPQQPGHGAAGRPRPGSR